MKLVQGELMLYPDAEESLWAWLEDRGTLDDLEELGVDIEVVRGSPYWQVAVDSLVAGERVNAYTYAQIAASSTLRAHLKEVDDGE